MRVVNKFLRKIKLNFKFVEGSYLMIFALILIDKYRGNTVYDINTNLFPSVDTFLRAKVISQRGSFTAIMMRIFALTYDYHAKSIK